MAEKLEGRVLELPGMSWTLVSSVISSVILGGLGA